jgi:serine/threonine protein kinase
LSEDLPPQLAGFRAGSLMAGYRLEAQVGAGGMAVVFRAHDERLGRLVALKILAPALAADGAFRRRFIAESRAAAAVDDPHIIPVYEAGEADGALFIAMRFVRGGDLRLVLDREGALPPGRAAAFISPVASALDAAHGAGLVHRDVKPANILVDARPGRPDHVYLSDFGVSKGAVSSVSLTAPGQFLGTPHYSAPEQIQGRAVDGRTDQYALACVAYELLTGTVPFERDQGMAVLLAHLSEAPPPLRARRPGLPAAADQVLAKGLAKAAEKRYGSCRDFADALREALGLAPYHSRGSPASDHQQPQIVTPQPQPGLSGTAAAGKPAVPADQSAAATVDSMPVGGPGQADGVPAAAVIVTDPARQGSGTDAGAANVRPAEEAHTIRAEPRSHRARQARGQRRRILAASLAALLAVIVFGGGYSAWRWSQDQYYVGADTKGEVVIYRGVNQRIAGTSLSKAYQPTGILLAQVPSNYQQTLKATDAVSNLADARNIVANVRTAVTNCNQAYNQLATWVTEVTSYQTEVTEARQQHKSAKNIPKPGAQPPKAPAMCPSPQEFGITPSSIVPPSTASGHS